MTNTWRYRSTIKSRPFFYIETKKLAQLLLQGLNDLELREQVVKENIFQSSSIPRRKEIASTIIRRLRILDEFLLTQIEKNTVDTSKSIVLYSIIKTDRLFHEFMHEVIYEKTIISNHLLNEADFDYYFETKKVQSKTVASWTDYTIYKLKQVYKRILTEAGFIMRDGKRYEILTPVIDPTVVKHIKEIETTLFIPFILGGGK